MPNLMSPYGVNGEIQEPQWSSNPGILLSTHHQQPPTPLLTTSSSSSSSTCTIEMPINSEQLALNDQYATGCPLVDPRLVNNYYESTRHVPGAAFNDGNTWRPLMANGMAPVGHCSSSDSIQNPEPNEPQKQKRIRTAFTDVQIARMEEEFAVHPYVNRDQRNQLAQELGLMAKSIKIWFQNQRMKMKKAQKDVKKCSCPTGDSSPRNKCNGYIPLSVMAPQQYQITSTVDVTPTTYRNSCTVPSNIWNNAQMPSTSAYSITYTNQKQEEFVYQNSEGQIMRNELSASTANEWQMQAVNSGQLATWTPDYSNNVTTEVQPNMQQGPHK